MMSTGRRSVFEIPTDTTHFTPLQLQPRALLSLSFNALSRWLRQHLISFPELIRRHRRSVVILGADIDYLAPLGFFDGDHLKVSAGLRVLRAGSRAELNVSFAGVEETAARVRILLCPVEIIDPVSLTAAPCTFDGDILAAFRADEVEPASPARPLPQEKGDIEGAGIRLAEARWPFVVHRHLCEVADQWAFLEVAALVGASRESLAMERGADVPLLRAGLSLPLRRFSMELSRPYFWFQPGAVETVAYRHDDRLALVHRLVSSVPGGEQHGVIVERM